MSKSFYNSAAWQRLRIQVIAEAHGKCERCGAHLTTGVTSPDAVEVDHIKPHKGDRALFFSRSNLQALCKACHSGWKQRIERSNRLQREDDWSP